MADSYPRIAQVVLDTTDARGLAEFYRQLFGLEYRESDVPPPDGEPDPQGQDWLQYRSVSDGVSGRLWGPGAGASRRDGRV